MFGRDVSENHRYTPSAYSHLSKQRSALMPKLATTCGEGSESRKKRGCDFRQEELPAVCSAWSLLMLKELFFEREVFVPSDIKEESGAKKLLDLILKQTKRYQSSSLE